jgi:hypothetical protein
MAKDVSGIGETALTVVRVVEILIKNSKFSDDFCGGVCTHITVVVAIISAETGVRRL